MSPLVAARTRRTLGTEARLGPLLRLTCCASPWSCRWGCNRLCELRRCCRASAGS